MKKIEKKILKVAVATSVFCLQVYFWILWPIKLYEPFLKKKNNTYKQYIYFYTDLHLSVTSRDYVLEIK